MEFFFFLITLNDYQGELSLEEKKLLDDVGCNKPTEEDQYVLNHPAINSHPVLRKWELLSSYSRRGN